MDYISITLIIVTLINLLLGAVILISGKNKKINWYYFLNIFFIVAWTATILIYRLAPQDEVFFWTKTLYVSASLIASTFLFFTYVFPERDKKLSYLKLIKIFLPNIILIFLIIFNGGILKEVYVVEGGENVIIFGKTYFIYAFFIIFYFSFSFYRLFIKYLEAKNKLKKRQIAFLLIGYVMSGTIAVLTNLLLPWFGYYDLNWAGQVSSILMVIFATYSIFRYNLFNVRVISSQLFVFSLWVFILVRLLLSEDIRERIISGGLFVTTVFVGILLMRSILKEVNQREEIEKLANKLQKINKRLRELDQMKNEFLSLATHQIRSPLTSMKGYVSMILEGDYGEVDERLKEPLSVVEKSSHNLVKVVNEFLDVSQIEQGKMEYNYEIHDIRKLVEDVVREYAPAVEEKGLKLNFEASEGDYSVKVDENKIEQVIGNLINNSIKYTLKGEITVKLSKPKEETVRLEVIDTGVGIDSEEIPHLFTKFRRAKGAYKVSSTGSGLGIYLAKMIAEAHGGNIRVHSEGEGKGSVFTVEIPIFSKE